jgi:hypothetical protein
VSKDGRRGTGILVAAIAGLAAAVIIASLPTVAMGGGVDVVVESVDLGASHGLAYRSATNDNTGGSAYGIATCPATQDVTGGGAGISGDPSTAWIIDSARNSPPLAGIGPRRAWAGGGWNNAGAVRNVSTVAICGRRDALRPRTETLGTTVEGMKFAGSVKCPHGTSVTGGGLLSEGNADEILVSAPLDGPDSNRVPDDGWRAKIIASQDLRNVTFHAICTDEFDLAYRTTRQAVTGFATDGAACPTASAVTGGGASISGGAGAHLASLQPVDQADAGSVPDDGWRAQASVGPSPRTFKTYAICK